MKYYVAELVSTGIAFLCALTNHAGACWLWRKLMPLDNWADRVMYPPDGVRARKAHNYVPIPAPVVYQDPPCNCYTNPLLTFSGGYGPAAQSWHYCPTHGMVRDA